MCVNSEFLVFTNQTELLNKSFPLTLDLWAHHAAANFGLSPDLYHLSFTPFSFYPFAIIFYLLSEAVPFSSAKHSFERTAIHLHLLAEAVCIAVEPAAYRRLKYVVYIVDCSAHLLSLSTFLIVDELAFICDHFFVRIGQYYAALPLNDEVSLTAARFAHLPFVDALICPFAFHIRDFVHY